MPSPSSLILKDHQREHYETCLDILTMPNKFYIDTSPTGRGKTFIVMKIALAMKVLGKDIPIIVFCPAQAVKNWQDYLVKYSVPNSGVISYECLTGSTTHPPKYPILVRKDYKQKVSYIDDDGNTIEKVEDISEFTPHKQFIDECKMGLFVIFDEAHLIMNPGTLRFNACCTLTKHMTYTENPSRYALLSATLMDQNDAAHVNALYKLLNLSDKARMHQTINNVFEPLALEDIIKECYQLDADTTEDILNQRVLSSQTANEVAYELFVEVINEKYGSAIPENPELIRNLDIANAFFDVDDKDVYLRIKDAVDRLKSTTKYRRGSNGEDIVDRTKFKFTEVGRIVAEIQLLMCQSMIQAAEQMLAEDPDCKVVVGVNNYNAVDELVDGLKRWNPIVLTGQLNPAKRAPLVARFQTSPYARLIICNTKVLSVAIDLDDQVGNAKRKVIVFPDYDLKKLIQFIGRFNRDETKSVATIRIVYPPQNMEYSNVLNALYRKGDRLNETTNSRARGTKILPKDFSNVTISFAVVLPDSVA